MAEFIKKITLEPFDYGCSTNFVMTVSVGSYTWRAGMSLYSQKSDSISDFGKLALEEWGNGRWLRHIGAA
jgi:hypothetical protein